MLALGLSELLGEVVSMAVTLGEDTALGDSGADVASAVKLTVEVAPRLSEAGAVVGTGDVVEVGVDVERDDNDALLVVSRLADTAVDGVADEPRLALAELTSDDDALKDGAIVTEPLGVNGAEEGMAEALADAYPLGVNGAEGGGEAKPLALLDTTPLGVNGAEVGMAVTLADTNTEKLAHALDDRVAQDELLPVAW